MFDYGINFEKVIRENLPSFLHGFKRINRLKAMILPFKIIYEEFTVLRTEYMYKCRFNSEIIYLEKALNDRFDPVNKEIYIEKASYTKTFVYLKTELKPAVIMYRRWNSATNYVTGNFVWFSGQVYIANSGNINKTPGVDPEWTVQPTRSVPVLRNKVNFNGGTSFFVFVKNTLVYNENEMRGLIDYYRMAGRGYLIKEY